MRRIGIDFGTCNIKGAEKKKNGNITYVNLGKAMSGHVIPNAVFYGGNKEGHRIFVGKTALMKGMSSESDLVRNIKAYLQEQAWVRKLSSGRTVNAFDVTSDIMACLYEDIYNSSKGEEISATITVPVNFSKRQQMFVEEAAKKAGFQVDAVITEPFASLFYLMQGHFGDVGHRILVCDIGGGTLDLCLAEIKHIQGETVVETKATVGISYGGNDINHDILEKILKKREPEKARKILEEETNILHRKANWYHMMEAIDTLKCELFGEEGVSETDSTEVFVVPQDGIPISFGEVSVGEIYKMFQADNLGGRLARLLDKLFDDSELIPTDITDIFLIGGSSSIPYFKDSLTAYFSGYGHGGVDKLFEANDGVDQEDRLYMSVSAGAAIYNEIVSEGSIKIRDRIPFMVYTKDESGKQCAKLRKNDYYKDYSSALAPVTDWMKRNKQIGVYQTIFGEQDKEVFLGYVPMDKEMVAHATLYRLAVDKKRTIRMEFGYLLDVCVDVEDTFCVDWCEELNIEMGPGKDRYEERK